MVALTPPELEKLDKLNQALIQRPTLRLLVPGTVDAKADSAVLRESRIDAVIDAKLTAMTSEEDNQDDSEIVNRFALTSPQVLRLLDRTGMAIESSLNYELRRTSGSN